MMKKIFKTMHDNMCLYNDCFADKIFWETFPLNLGQHAFKTTAITPMSPRIEKIELKKLILARIVQ